MDCVFCKIVKGEIPSLKVYEDEFSLVFMDIADDVDGHLVAIPKRHASSILDCDENSLSHLIKAVKKVSEHLVNNCGYNGVNLLNASGKAAGQSVDHFHIHIIPRKNDDVLDTWPNFTGAKCKREEIYKKIKL